LRQSYPQILCAFVLLQHLFELNLPLAVKVFWLVPVVLIVLLFHMHKPFAVANYFVQIIIVVREEKDAMNVIWHNSVCRCFNHVFFF